MREKIIGYLLIVIGLIMIILPIISVFNVFTNRAQPAILFNLEGINIDLSKLTDRSLTQQQANISDNNQLKTEVIPSESLNKPLNLISHIVLMGFVSSAGLKIATVGTQLARTINVKIKENSGPNKN